MGIKCRLVEQISRRYHFSVYWTEESGQYHEKLIEISKEEYDIGDCCIMQEKMLLDNPFCDCHKIPVPKDAHHSTGYNPIWNTEDGELHPGDMFYQSYYHEDGKCGHWNNCTDPRGHLIVKMPDGGTWDTDSRASNCTMKEDKTHRCWVKHGEAPNITVDKQGVTCQAGAGSIQMISWHGFLRNGELVQ